MWTAVFLSKDKNGVDILKQALKENNILFKIIKKDEYYEFYVPSQEVCSAHNIIIEKEI